MIKPFTLTQETTTSFEDKAIGGEASLYLGATTVNPIDAFDGQFFTKTAATYGIYLFTNRAWVRQTTPTNDMISRASFDIMNAVNQGLGTITDYTASGVNFQLAMIQNLFVGSINILVTAGSNIVSDMPYASQTVTSDTDVALVFTDTKSGAEYSEFQIPASGSINVNASVMVSAGTAYLSIVKNGSIVSSASTAVSTTLTQAITISADDDISGSMRVSTGASAYVDSGTFSISIAEVPGIMKYLVRPQ